MPHGWTTEEWSLLGETDDLVRRGLIRADYALSREPKSGRDFKLEGLSAGPRTKPYQELDTGCPTPRNP